MYQLQFYWGLMSKHIDSLHRVSILMTPLGRVREVSTVRAEISLHLHILNTYNPPLLPIIGKHLISECAVQV